MTYFCKILEQFCDRAEITLYDALKITTKYKNATPAQLAQTVKFITATNFIPDDQTVRELAYYFGVGTDMFFEPTHKNEPDSKIYLAGPITGYPDFNERFDNAHAFLESKGYQVFNPARVTAQLPSTYMCRKDFIDLGITILGMCNGIALIPGYESSTGCITERAYAIANRMCILELTSKDLKIGKELRNRKA